jgi:hypothetical protein
MRALYTLLFSLLFTLATSTALAQEGATPPGAEPSASQVALARRLFADGVRASEEHRLADAQAAFERSYALSQREVTLLNLAVVLAESGKLVAAVEAYRRFLARADGAIEARHGDNARTALAALEARLSNVTITVRAIRPTDEVRIDDTVIAHEGLGLELPVDPGTHSVEVRRGRRSCARRAIRVAEGARADVELDATCPPSAEEAARLAAAEAEAQREREEAASAPSAWVWVGVGAGVLAVAAAIIVIVLFTQPEPIDPYVGNLGPGTLTLP